jgi:hypothetical protein
MSSCPLSHELTSYLTINITAPQEFRQYRVDSKSQGKGETQTNKTWAVEVLNQPRCVLLRVFHYKNWSGKTRVNSQTLI